MMTLEEALQTPPAWLGNRRAGDDIVQMTVGRLTRNLRGHAFPGWSTPESRAEVLRLLEPAVRALPAFRSAWRAEMSDLSYETRRALLSCKLLTPCMAARGEGCRVLIPRRRHALAMLNEEEHLVIHTFRSGAASAAVAEELAQMASALEPTLPFAHDRAFGYLSSLPSEAGDGLQLYQVLHLPALTMAGMMSQVTRAAEKLHVNIAPFYADGQDETGNTYVFFSIPGPEGSSEELIQYFDGVMAQLCERERQVRVRLQENSADRLTDCIGRAYGLLRYARRLSLKELRDTCSVLRLATVLGHLEWAGGAAHGVGLLRELCRNLTVQGALVSAAEEERQPQHRADVVRRVLAAEPHHFNTLYA